MISLVIYFEFILQKCNIKYIRKLLIMYYSSQKKNLERSIVQEQVIGAQGSSIKEYLNMKRYAKDKVCLWIFLIYLIGAIIILGIGFFYGNYDSIGKIVTGNPPANINVTICPKYIDQNYSECVDTCTNNNTLYLQIVCLTDINQTAQSQALSAQISMYNLKYCFPQITYISISLLAATTFLYLFIVCMPKIIYLYILAMFIMLLGLAFYLLKSLQIRTASYSGYIYSGSIFYTDENRITSLSFLLLAIYLVIFPLVLFSSKKIQYSVKILENLTDYFKKMLSMNLFTLLIIVICWGLLLLEVFLVMNIYSAGTITTSVDSFFYLYETINLAHTAALIVHFIGAYWIFGTLVSLHKYFISSAMYIWYFHENQQLKPVRRGLQKSYHHLGSAATDAFLMPVQWILLLLYSICKEDQSEEITKDYFCKQCLLSIRKFINRLYYRVNRTSPSASVIINANFVQSCEKSAAIFSQNNHRFFNVGGTLTIFLTFFCSMFWILISYIILNSVIYSKTFPPPITSLTLPIFSMFIIGFVIGCLFTNLFTSAIDSLLFCFIIEKKTNSEPLNKNQIRTILEQFYYKNEQEKQQSQRYYQNQQDQFDQD